ncbi:LppM family (lipo)protein [Buchananella hordeovulneris]|uniref:LppM family (lipo)protein n=1 Tax=Buchananella hordeovulneris TaxID=52770 RepID=UPI000F5FA8E0|nr:hypothetical protein [Buchananella hordeovulneris]MDO5081036.1 hypothetical protein [Buchananella hordeovulneris]RRD51954.1 hypothetical protein EII12_06685 [Buchananella hordeovulneris]
MGGQLRRWGLAVSLPVVLLVSACQAHLTATVYEDQTYTLAAQLSVPRFSEELLPQSMADICQQIAAQVEQAGGPAVATSLPASNVCELSSQRETLPESANFQRVDDTFEMTMPAELTGIVSQAQRDYGSLGLDITAVLVFPGKVLHSDYGTVEGNTVTVKGEDSLAPGGKIVAEAIGDSDTSQVVVPAPWDPLPWLVAGGAALLVLLLLLLAWRRARRARRARHFQQTYYWQ